MEPIKAKDGIAWTRGGDLLLMLWRDPASRPRWRVQHDEMERLSKQQPDGVVCMSLILSTSSPPDRTLRAEIQSDIRSMGPRLRKYVFVPLGDSVWMSMVRTLVRVTFLLSGMGQQQAVGSSVEDGLDRVRLVAGPQTPPAAELRQRITEMCVALAVPDLIGASRSAASR